MTIILYDAPSPEPKTTWSPYMWKTRFCLNYKGIPYKTEWVEFVDIEEHSKKLGLKPTGKNWWGGADLYSLPAIHDPSTGVYIADSWLIAEYLEKQYPDTPSLFPNGTKGLQEAFTYAFLQSVLPMRKFLLPATPARLNPRSAEYFRRTREIYFGKKLEDVSPKGEAAIQDWAKIEQGFNQNAKWFSQTDEKGLFMLGDTLSWADINAVGFLRWMRFIFGEDSEEWKRIASWSGGRWSILLTALDRYSAIL